MIKRVHSSEGFTLVELMLAMTVFIAITMLFTAGFIAINRTFARTIVRKQLAESVQVVNEKITSTLRQNSLSSTPIPCSSNDSSCSSPSGGMTGEWQVLCVGETRFYWGASAGGMYADQQKNCEDDALDTANADTILDGRFVIDTFTIHGVAGADHLYNVAGVARTINDNAFNIDGSDPFQTTCRGTTQSPFAQTCAIEKFSFIVNAQGGSV